MDIKMQMALDLAQSLGAVIDPMRCDKCDFPLMMIPAQGMPFCGLCTTRRIRATDAKALLLRIKLAEKGILIPKESSYRAVDPIRYEPWRPIHNEEGQGPFQTGMPL